MPKYSYQCDKCDTVSEEIRPARDRDYQKMCTNGACNGPMVRKMSRVMEPTIMETVDSHRNVQWRRDQENRIKKRAKDFFVKHEMDELIAKHGEKEARKMGWIKKDGKKNKGE